MRTLPAILLAALTALVIIASAILATQLGVRDWPTPPLPDTATRLVTPTEAAGRASDKVRSDSGKRGNDTPGVETIIVDVDPSEIRAESSGRATGRSLGDQRRGDAAPAPRADAPRITIPPLPTEEDEREATPAPDAVAEVGPEAPNPDAAPVGENAAPVVESAGQAAQARTHDDVPPVAAAPDADDDDDPAPPSPGEEAPRRRRGPIQNVLHELTPTP